ncbi:MAG: hypothetical protein PF961_07805, partial [Planctomycetota bacterium]|nr:hypothetical protein [Planctomycetota bacterium]
FQLKLIDQTQVRAEFPRLNDTDLRRVLQQIISNQGTDLAALVATGHELKALAETGRKVAVSEAVLWPWIETAVRTALLEPDLCAFVLNNGGAELFGYGDTNYSGKTIRRTIELEGGGELVLSATNNDDDDSFGDGERTWTLEKSPKSVPNAEAVAATVALLRTLEPDDADTNVYRQLAIALLSGTAPAAELASAWNRHEELLRPLMVRHPELRPAVVAEINKDHDKLYAYSLVKYLKPGNPDLAAAALAVLLREYEDRWDVKRVLPYLQSLDSATLDPLLQAALANGTATGALDNGVINQVLEKREAVSLGIVLALLPKRDIGDLAVAAYTEADSATLATALASLDAATVRERAANLRRLRTAGQPTFDAALPPLLVDDNAITAAWLRTGIPLQAGLSERYRSALEADDPALYLVGAAVALKQSRLPAEEFLARCGNIDPSVLGDAAAVAQRYVAEQLPEHDAAVATILERCSARDLSAWLLVAAPGKAVTASIVKRCGEPATALLILPILEHRVRQDKDAWRVTITALNSALGDDTRARYRRLFTAAGIASPQESP